MSYKPKPLTYYEKSFLIGSSFLSGSAFAFCGHKLVSAVFPVYAYLFYLATLCICLQLILRYFIIARVFQTERDLWAWSLSMMIALLGPMTVYEALLGPRWFLCVVLLLIPGNLKTIQSRKAIRNNPGLTEWQKIILSRLQVGLFWYQSYIAALMFGFWLATTETVGTYMATNWFGVSNLPAWTNGVATLGGGVCLLASAHLAVRILAWHRDYLRMFPSAPASTGLKSRRNTQIPQPMTTAHKLGMTPHDSEPIDRARKNEKVSSKTQAFSTEGAELSPVSSSRD